MRNAKGLPAGSWPLRSAVGAVRSGMWLGGARLRRIGLVLAIGYAATWVYLFTGEGRFDPLGRAIGADFAAFYGVSRALLDGLPAASLYSPQALNDVIRDLTNGDVYVWLYPPTALFPYWPLAKLPYFAALALWIAAGVAAYVAVAQRVLPGRFALGAALLFPAVYCCALHGHNGLLNAVLIGAALLLMPARPVSGGALLGAAAMLKPHLVLLVPVALLAGRRWRSLGSMAGTIVLLGVAAALAFGPEVWLAFLASTRVARSMLETEGVPYAKMASVFAAVRVLGFSSLVAYAAQGIATVAAVGTTVWVWSRPRPYEHQVAALLLAGALATPYVYDYDLPAMGVGLAFWARAALRDGWRPWEKSALFAAWLVPIFTRPVATVARLGVLPLVLILVLPMVVRGREAGEVANKERLAG